MINGVNEMNDRVNGITSNTTNSLSNQERSSSIMSDLESIVKIGVRIMWDECKIHGRMVMSLIYGVNDLNDVSRPKGMTKIMTKIMTKRLTKVDTGMMEITMEEYVGYERNRYGFPRFRKRHIPKDMVSSQERSSS